MELVTGATGMVGMHVVAELLRAGRPVRALRRAGSDSAPLEAFLARRGFSSADLVWAEADLLDGDLLDAALAGCTRVYHCAALVSFHPADARALDRVNRAGTAALVDAMLHAGVPECVYISSVAALGRRDGEPTHEGTPFSDGPGVSAYARSKYAGELEVWRGGEEGLRVLSLLPSVVLGEGDFRRSSAELFATVDRGLAFYPRGANGFVAAEDVARAALELPEIGGWGERYLLNAETWAYREVWAAMADALGRPAPRVAVRPWMAGIAWRAARVAEAFTGRKTLVTREALANTDRHHDYASDRLAARFGEAGKTWAYTPIADTIRATATAYRAQFPG
jgi:nucleoside-diphosphate-sugar epimerase